MDSCDELSKTRLSKHANAKFSDSCSYGSGTEDVFCYHLRRERLTLQLHSVANTVTIVI